MHKNLKLQMTNISTWLDIKFDNSLLKETYPSGEEVYVDSAYLLEGRKNLKSNYVKIFQ